MPVGQSGAQLDAVGCLVPVDQPVAFECGQDVVQPGTIGFFFGREQLRPEFHESQCCVRWKAAQQFDDAASPDAVGLAPMRRL